MSDGPLLTMRNLRVVYPGDDGDFRAVRNVSFSLGRERLGIVGESGSGKSTTGRAIMGLIPYPGRVEADVMRLGDTDLTGLDEKGFRRLRGKRIAMVLQDPKFSLDPVMTVGKQIAETHRYHFRSSKQAARAAALEMLEAVHIRDPARVYDQYAHQVSGGMGQRIMIAMMLIAGPDILIADEPTSALDVSVQQQVLAIMDEMVKSRGMGLILISHNLHLVVIVLRPGAGDVRRPDRRGLRCRPVARSATSLHQGSARRPSRTRPPPRRTAAVAARSRMADRSSRRRGSRRLIELEGVSVTYGAGPLGTRRPRYIVSHSSRRRAGPGRRIRLRQIHRAARRRRPDPARRRKRGDQRPRIAQPASPRIPKNHPDGLPGPLRIAASQPDGRPDAQRADRHPPPRQRRESASWPPSPRSGLAASTATATPTNSAAASASAWPSHARLILEPKVLLLDEPTSALDVSVQAEILNLLTRLRRDHGLTMLMVSHDLAVIAHICDRIGVMHSGRLLEMTTAAALAEGRVTDPYSQQLLRANQGFDASGVVIDVTA